jgi:hypothetical protein
MILENKETYLFLMINEHEVPCRHHEKLFAELVHSGRISSNFLELVVCLNAGIVHRAVAAITYRPKHCHHRVRNDA